MLLQNNRFEEAEEYCKKAIELKPDFAEAYNNLGLTFQKLTRLNEAEINYKKAIEINPDFVEAHANLGLTLQDLKRLNEAEISYKNAIDLKPNFLKVHYNLGILFFDQGKFIEAEASYKKAIVIKADYTEAHNNLGVTLYGQGKFNEAEASYKKVVEINPNHVDAHNNLGILFQELGEPQKALDCYKKVIVIDSNNLRAIYSVAILFGSFAINNFDTEDYLNLKKMVLFLFQRNDIQHQDIFSNTKLLLFLEFKENEIIQIINSKSLLENKVIKKFLKEELFHLMLQKSLITDELIEKLLTKLRYEILFVLANENQGISKKYLEILISLAEQCWINEYIYFESKKETDQIKKLKNKIEHDKEINELEIAVLGCYIPLNTSKIIINKLINYKSSNILFNDLINVQIKEPLKELELIKSIDLLDKIVDPTSKKVRYQYEDYPYPRWRYTYNYSPQKFFDVINVDIKPNKTIFNNRFNNPNILIAGCGTGSHSISATKYKDSNICAVDLSLASIAYSKRKTEELGYSNLKYLHGDLLQVAKLNKKFDIIECIGTLHHMNSPIEGFKKLLSVLQPNGFLKLGLYSKTARQGLSKAKKLIKDKKFKNTKHDMSLCRQEILKNKEDPIMQKIIYGRDFYSTSSIRDLLFHVQEHQFTIPEISKILNDLNLEFLGFVLNNPSVKKKFSKIFPDDKNNISLNNWHQFELDNPDIFFGMYNFWVKKI